VLPTGVKDVNGQQLDLRRENSWLLKIGEVSERTSGNGYSHPHPLLN